MGITKFSFKFIGEREATKDNIILDRAALGWGRGNKGCFFYYYSFLNEGGVFQTHFFSWAGLIFLGARRIR